MPADPRFEIRSRALGVMTSISMHSENLCSQVLEKSASILLSCKREETYLDALLLLAQFCKFFPQQMLRKDVVSAVSCNVCLPRRCIFEAAALSFVNLATVAFSDNDFFFSGKEFLY